jgi:hypothetical protein
MVTKALLPQFRFPPAGQGNLRVGRRRRGIVGAERALAPDQPDQAGKHHAHELVSIAERRGLGFSSEVNKPPHIPVARPIHPGDYTRARSARFKDTGNGVLIGPSQAGIN